MEDVRQLVQEEGREARNLVAFHVAVDTPGSAASRISRKPPRSLAPPVRRAPPRSVARRSASAGRDKRSELRARYWALLFGDLQRAIGEIYNTVEAHENLNECQEVILVLENYTRDFKALGEWFRLKWEYDNTPPPQRPQSLAWEIRKTDFVRPESRRTHSVKSSPSVSGKNSPCLSGHNTPSGKNSPVTGKSSPGSGKISPRISGHATSPKANLEFFGSKVMSKIATKPEVKTVKEGRLSDIKEKDVKDSPEEEKVVLVSDDATADSKQPDQKPIVELGKAKECSNISPKQVVIKSPRHVKTETKPAEELSSQGKATTAKLDAMENEFLAKNLVENSAKNDNLLNQDVETEKPSETVQNDQDKHSGGNASDLAKDSHSESPTKSEDNFADVSNESSPIADENQPDKNKERNAELPENKREMNSEEPSKQSIEVKTVSSQSDAKDEKTSEPLKEQEKETDKIKEGAEKDDAKKEQDTKKAEIKTEQKPCSRPAYSQAAAKPKPVTTKPELKPPVRATTPILRSKTIVEIGPNTVSKTRQFPKRNQTSKCSYPFNLTTGRTSLFDSAPSTKVVKKPLNRNVPMASGDTKPGQNKIEPPKKRPPRPTSLKLNEKGDKKETANPSLEKIKDCDEYSSTDTIVTQIDMSRIESSESLKTLVPEDQIRDVANSVEVLNVDNNKSDNDGWLTVKSRRLSRESKKQSKSHWSNRFHQPSATTSLPTLNMIESPKQEVNPIVHAHKAKLDRAKSEQPETVKTPRKAEKVKVTVKPKAVSKMKDPAMIRQKSDVTGLKTHSARNKAAKREKIKDLNKTEGELTINRLHSSLESLTGLARSQESTEDAFDFDKWKAEFKSTYFKYLDEDDHMTNHNEILKTADPSEMSEIAEMTSQIEENEKKLSWALDFQTDVDQRKLCEEEDLLNRQILELQEVSDIDMDTETDDTETDAEILIEEPHLTTSQETLGALATSLEHQYETALAGMSWAERVDTLVVLEALVARDPGRAQQLHAKLSQGIKRRGSLQDALRRLQAKQARAERQRLEYQTERAKKIHQLLARVEEVKVAKNQLIEEKRMRMERRLQKAAENRDQHLKDIVRKAHDEEEKLREIAFIKQLEAENRRHEFLDQCRSHTTRLRQMRRDRLSKLEQKAAREAAVGARRAALEAARRRHVAGLLQRRRERDARVDQLKELKKQERGDAAREKAEGVKSRLSALAAAAELEADALRSRIRDKQDASQQRLESHLQAIREKATRQAASESQDLISKEERELQEEAERLEQERREREKQKAVKKRARKVKQKLLATANETLLLDENTTIEPNNPSTNKLYKVVHQLSNILTPLLDTDNNDNGKQNNDTVKQNGNTGKANHDAGKMNDKVDDIIVINDEVEKNNKKNKSKNNNNKITNGIDGNESAETKKSKKKKNTDEKLAENVKNAGNNKEKDVTPVKEIIIAENTASDSVSSINVSKKKNKKNKNSNTDKNEITNMKEPPKLVKTGSICSSLSDTSKASYRSDKRTKVNIDSTLLERHLNELHRMMDKDKTSNDKAIPQKLHGLKTLGHLMAVAAEREDLASQFTTKCLTTAVTIISRVISTCKTSAAYFITTNMCVHIVKLLSTQLEKDLHSDQKETELAKQLSDCLAVALDSVLYATRTHEKNRGDEKESGDELLTALRSRAHTLISYLCLCGCVTKAEAAGEVTGNVQTLVTVCVDLCQPCDVDAGTERTSAVQSLRIALGTSICLSRAELCTIFNDEQSLGEAARSVSLLRSTAELDYRIVQEAFGEGGWPLEFRAAVARLLSQYAPNDKDAPKSNSRLNERLEQSVAESMVLDLIVLVGFVVVNNPQMQETICDGWSVIKTLCTLPANWLVSRSHSPALLPTLAALAEWPSAHAAIAAELSLEMIEEFLESAEAQKVKLVQVMKQGRAKKATVKNKKQ